MRREICTRQFHFAMPSNGIHRISLSLGKKVCVWAPSGEQTHQVIFRPEVSCVPPFTPSSSYDFVFGFQKKRNCPPCCFFNLVTVVKSDDERPVAIFSANARP